MPRAVAVLILAILAGAAVAEHATAIPIELDHRGLLTIEGVLRMQDGSHWGASNLVVKPFGGWAAQDYCLSNVVRTGAILTADFATTPKAHMVETVAMNAEADGRTVTRVSYVLTAKDGGGLAYEKVYAILPIAPKDFVGGKAILADGQGMALPAEPAGEQVVAPGGKSLAIEGGGKRLLVRSEKLAISLRDLRPKTAAFHIWLELPEPKAEGSLRLDFEVTAENLR